MKYDVFISHASEDKGSFVQALAQELEESGLSVWYDEFILRLGDSLSETINFGLSKSNYGIVVLSHNFFQKRWPKRELNALLNREDIDEKVVIPIWHNVEKSDVLAEYPLIADKLAVRTSEGMREVTRKVFEVIRPQSIAHKHYENGVVLENNKAIDGAIIAYMKALRLNPDHLEALKSVSRIRNLNLPKPLYVSDSHIKIGIIRFYNEAKNFGYIDGDDGKEYFFTSRNVEIGHTLQGADRVAFLTEKGDRGLKAISIRLV